MKGSLTLLYVLRTCLVFTLMVAVPLMASAEPIEEWVARYHGPGDGYDFSHAIAVDASGNIYVAGESQSGTGWTSDYATVKYDTDGNELWVARYNGPGNSSDVARGIAVDASGNVYVTGESYGSGTNWDYATVKYDTDGNELWVARYNGPGDDYDAARAIAVDASGNAYVTGRSYGDETWDDYATVKYDTDGNQLWVSRYNGPVSITTDDARAIAVDASGNVYVTGSSYTDETWNDYATVKYDTDGNELWVARYNGPGNGVDSAEAIAVDASGNVYVTGRSSGSGIGDDYATVKYDTDGNELWVARYNGPANGYDNARAIAVGTSGNVYVTGGSSGSGTDWDYATAKYDTDGNEHWVARYNGPVSGEVSVSAIAVDASENVYVTGSNPGSGTGDDYATVKYDTDGNELWVARYNGPANGYDNARAIAVDALGNVYVTGSSPGSGTGADYATVKYAVKYVREVFLISDEVWRDVLSLVPLTTWTDNDGVIHKYPTLIYHKEENSFDADSIIHFLQQYSPTHLTIFGETPQELDNLLIAAPPLGAGLAEAQISKITMNDYFSYWPKREVFVIAEDDYKTGLMASVFASYIHAPLVFEDHVDYDVIRFKKVYIIGKLNDQQAIEDIADVLQTYSLTDLQKRYVALTGTDKIILVNPEDLGIAVMESYVPDKSTVDINRLYTNHSLAAPILASAKHELIIFNEANDYQIIDQFVEDEISALNPGLPYLTIIASPSAVPMSRAATPSDGCCCADRVEVDSRHYASLGINNEYVDLPVGRIFGISTSDVSSYIARDLFFDEIVENNDALVFINENLAYAGYATYEDFYTQAIRDQFDNTTVYLPENVTDYSYNEYDDNYLLLFYDHGYTEGFVHMMSSDYLIDNQVYLDLPVIMDVACATCKYHSTKGRLFCVQNMRRGAMLFQGAVDISYWHNQFEEILNETFSQSITIGEAIMNAKNSDYDINQYNFCMGLRGDPFYALIGDPTFKPNWR